MTVVEEEVTADATVDYHMAGQKRFWRASAWTPPFSSLDSLETSSNNMVAVYAAIHMKMSFV